MSGYMFTLMLSGKKLRPHDFSPRTKTRRNCQSFQPTQTGTCRSGVPQNVNLCFTSDHQHSIPHATASLYVSICVLSILRSNPGSQATSLAGNQEVLTSASSVGKRWCVDICWYGDSWTGLTGPFQSSLLVMLKSAESSGLVSGLLYHLEDLQGLWGWIDPPSQMLWNDDTSKRMVGIENG